MTNETRIHPETPDRVYELLSVANGSLVADGYDTFDRHRPFYRVVDGNVEMALIVEGESDDDEYQIEQRTVDKDDFIEVAEQASVLKLWPYHDSPFNTESGD